MSPMVAALRGEPSWREGWMNVSLCSRRERYIRSVELTHGRALHNLRGLEVTRALAPSLVVLLEPLFRFQ